LGNGYALYTYDGSKALDYSYDDGWIYANANEHLNNNQRWIFDKVSPTISSSAEYGGAYSGNYLTKLTDQRGNSVDYTYDNNKGLLSTSSYVKNGSTNTTYRLQKLHVQQNSRFKQQDSIGVCRFSTVLQPQLG